MNVYRFECKQMWGSVTHAKECLKHPECKKYRSLIVSADDDVIVDKPYRTNGIFDGCVWKSFMSLR